MAQRVMTTGGYPVKLPDADEIASDITGDVMSRKVSVKQLTGMSDAVSDVIHAKSPKDIRDAAGIQESQIAVKGDPGKSAYEIAVQDGFEGSETEWLASLKGSDGKDGVNGTNGKDGANATTTASATSTTPGLMSATDKAKLDTFNAPAFNVVASGGRPVGTAFTIDANKNARVSYTISYSLSATLTIGQTIQIVASVDGKEVARMADGILLGLAGNLQKTKSFSFDVPAGRSVLLTKTGTSSIVATVVSGQEVLY